MAAAHARNPRRGLFREFLAATAVLSILVGAFFSPRVRHHATFSSVASVQRYFWPWVTPAALAVEPQGIAPQIDQAVYVHPKQVFLDKELRDGEGVPLWNPLSFAGTPFFSQTGSRLAYPPLLILTALLSPATTHDAYVILHLLVAGVAMFALMKHFGVGFSGALLAAIAWMFSSYALAWVMLEMFAAVVALLPAVILFIRRWYDRDSLPDLLVAGVLLGLLVLGASGDLALFSLLAAVAYAGALALTRVVRLSKGGASWPARLAVLAGPVLLGVGALAVGAASLLPYAELSDRSLRSSLPVSQLGAVDIGYFLDALRPPPTPADFAPAWVALNSRQVFVGSVTAALAVVGLFVRRTGAGIGRALALGILVLVTLPPAVQLVARVVPFVGQVANYGRSLFLWNLGVAILGGLGLDACLRALRSGTGVRRSALGASRGSWAPAAACAVLAVGCLAVTSAQLFEYGRDVNPPFQPRDSNHLFPSTPAVDAMQALIGEGAGRGRALGVVAPQGGEALVASSGMALDLPLGNGYEPVVARNVGTLWRVVAGEPLAAAQVPSPLTFLPRFAVDTMRADLLGRVATKAVLAPPGTPAPTGLSPVYAGADGIVFSVDGALPRASVVTDPVWVASDAEALAAFTAPAFDGRRQVVLVGSAEPAGGAPQSGAPPAEIRWVEDEADRLELSVRGGPGWLVVRDSWDPDWKAEVDGRATPIEKADFGFRAVRVPAGASTVTFTYRPTVAILGTGISAGSAVALLAAAAFGWVWRRSGTNHG